MRRARRRGVEPTVARSQQHCPRCQRWLLRWEGKDSPNCSGSRSPSARRMLLWRCSSHDSLRHAASVLLSARRTRDRGAYSRALSGAASRSERRPSVGLQQVVGLRFCSVEAFLFVQATGSCCNGDSGERSCSHVPGESGGEGRIL